ncbi:MAG: hypothetical protein TEF_14065 [Rhizobiales bacterium NRL2]|nr:MAG: hypothetical protein TEF_14065 [Rhizobiales bacterium NRL2]
MNKKLDEAMKEPGAVYDAPADVLADGDLNDDEKRRVLENWLDEAEQLSSAVAENMGGGEKAHVGAVTEALKKLKYGPGA